MHTDFLPPERETPSKVHEQFERFITLPELKNITDSIPDIFAILNSKRQIIFANERLKEMFFVSDGNNILGSRPGELLNCIYSSINEGGCGTSNFCKVCGAAKSIKSGLEGKLSVEECRIIAENNVYYDLRVWSKPLQFEEENYVVFVIQDISDEKRKGVLERLFFHDINNTASSLIGLSDTMRNLEGNIPEEFKELLYNSAINLVEEINSQKQLYAAEQGDLEIEFMDLDIHQIAWQAKEFFYETLRSEGKYILLLKEAGELIVETDKTILLRVLKNLLKNAIEAVGPGESISLAVEESDGKALIKVINPGEMEEAVKLQIFQRSFSTKGANRGLGTYSIKLFTEKYLKGKVEFSSDETNGTIFTISLNKKAAKID